MPILVPTLYLPPTHFTLAPTPPSTHPPERTRFPMESQQSLSLSQDQGPPHYFQAEQDIPPKRMGSKEPVQTVGISPGPTAGNPTPWPYNCHSHPGG